MFDYVRVHPEVREVTVIDEKNKVCGVLTRFRRTGKKEKSSKAYRGKQYSDFIELENE